MKNKKYPVFVFILLTFVVILLSFVFSLFDLQAEYSTVNSYSNTLQNNVVQVENLLSLEGVKYLLSNTVYNFVNFAPLGNLIIILIGIGVIEKTGFARTFFTLITQSFRKNSITYVLILLSIIRFNYLYKYIVYIPCILYIYFKYNIHSGIIKY